MLLPTQGEADRVDGGRGYDTASYAAYTVGVVVDLPNKNSGGGAAGQTFRSIEQIIGSGFADELAPRRGGTVLGEAGDDTLSSTSGAIMRGDNGLDMLNGDATRIFRDVFWLQFDQGADTVNNFLTVRDKLQINSSDFAGIGPTLEANELFNRLFDHDATGTDAQFVFQRNTQELWFHSEGTNTVTPVLIATIPGVLGLNTADFVVIA